MPTMICPIGGGNPAADFALPRALVDGYVTAAEANFSTSGTVSNINNLRYPTTYDVALLGTGAASVTVTTSSAKAVDAVMLAGHNLGSLKTSVTLTIYGQSFTVSPTDNSPILFLLNNVDPEATTASFTLAFPATSGVKGVATIQAGKALVFPHAIYQGIAPVELNRSVVASTQTSINGQALGLAIRRTGVNVTYTLGHCEVEFAYGDAFRAFKDAVEIGLGFFTFAWRPNYAPVPGAPRGVIYGTLSTAIKVAPMGQLDLQSISFSMDSSGPIY